MKRSELKSGGGKGKADRRARGAGSAGRASQSDLRVVSTGKKQNDHIIQ